MYYFFFRFILNFYVLIYCGYYGGNSFFYFGVLGIFVGIEKYNSVMLFLFGCLEINFVCFLMYYYIYWMKGALICVVCYCRKNYIGFNSRLMYNNSFLNCCVCVACLC